MPKKSKRSVRQSARTVGRAMGVIYGADPARRMAARHQPAHGKVTITVNGHGSRYVSDDDRWRAEAAAEAVIDAAGITAREAREAYQRQWEALDDEGLMTGAAAVWIAARTAADIAITEGWANPAAEVFCELWA